MQKYKGLRFTPWLVDSLIVSTCEVLKGRCEYPITSMKNNASEYREEIGACAELLKDLIQLHIEFEEGDTDD